MDIATKSITVPTTLEITGDVGYVEAGFSDENGDGAYRALIYSYDKGIIDLEISKSYTTLDGYTYRLKEGCKYQLSKIFFYDKDGKYIKRYVTPAWGHEELGEPEINYTYSFRVLTEAETVTYKLVDGDITNDETLTAANYEFSSILRKNAYGYNANVAVLPPHSRVKIDYNHEMFEGHKMAKEKTEITNLENIGEDDVSVYIMFYAEDSDFFTYLVLVTEGVTSNQILEHYQRSRS